MTAAMTAERFPLQRASHRYSRRTLFSITGCVP